MTRLSVAERIVRDREIVRLRNAGLPINTIAERLCVNRRTLFRVLKRGGPSQAALHGHPRVMAERDAEIVHAALTPNDDGEYPTLEAIGEVYGFTGERVRQILKRAGVKKPTSYRPASPKPPCAIEGCPDSATTLHGVWCSAHSKRRAPRVNLTCANPDCGNPIERLGSHYRPKTGQGLAFCNKLCQGKWLAANHGFGARRAG